LNTLKNKLIVDSRQNDLNEAKAQKIFDELKARLVAIINKLARDIARTRTQIREMKICVATETAIFNTANNKLLRNRRLKKAAAHTCADFAREFVEATRNRLEEIRTLHEVLKICARRFGELPHDLIAYLEEVKGGFRRYVNSTEFHKYVAYVEKHTADNAFGRALAHGRRHVPRKLEAEILAKKNLRRLSGAVRRPVKVVGGEAVHRRRRAARRAAARRERLQRAAAKQHRGHVSVKSKKLRKSKKGKKSKKNKKEIQ